jgi:uncharacterized membrane protein
VRKLVAQGAEPEDERAAEWGERSRGEPRWPASCAVAVAIILQLALPERLVLGPRWLLPALEALLGIALLVTNPSRDVSESRYARGLSIALIALINIANLTSLGYLIHALVSSHNPPDGKTLIVSSIPIWLTNVIVFGLWFWELDRGGPAKRTSSAHRQPDFLFPQMNAPGAVAEDWSPSFFDYLYTSFTNVTAFSPTDTMPLTPWAKVLMMVEALASLITIGVVISRAVNIL